MNSSELTQEQLDERIAILKRFRALLEDKRKKFQEYLIVLEKQHEVIQTEDVDAIVKHTEIEQGIISEINTIQKVITPLEDMYRTVYSDSPESEIPVLKTDLEQLQKDVLFQNEKNRDLLKTHMQVLRQKVVSMNNPYSKRSSIYASDAQTGTRIDINQ